MPGESPAAPPHGVIVVDKPRGPTSHDVVARVRRALRTREVGHAGTLDPMATGVLVVAIGEATKLLSHLSEQGKAYEATIALGVETDTLDAEGHETARHPLDAELLAALASPADAPAQRAAPLAPSSEAAPGDVRLARAIELEMARTEQVPPAFSAIQQGGVRSYERARRGEAVVLPPRAVQVHALSILARSAEPPSLSVAVRAAKGYYVRALARDLAAALGTVGHLTALRRTHSGCFSLADAVPLDVVSASGVLPIAQVARRALPVAQLSPAGADAARHGRVVPAGEVQPAAPGLAAWFAPDGALVALGEIDATGEGRVRRGFVGSRLSPPVSL